jgi:glycosyltransferase involved in cell wall biosynthesis
MVGEASYTYSGFGTYTNEIMKRLAQTNKYELAEFASYGFVNDPRDKDVGWRLYANAVKDNDQRANLYHSKHTYQWGEWRFDKVCLDFKPDIVWSIRDPWMDEWINDSPFRKFFHFVWMPTVDSAPQQEQWIDAFKDADGIFTYSDWNLEVLRKEGNGQIKLQCSASPGADLSIFKPIKDKDNHKFNMGLSPNMKIVGTVMRNQRRKLYPDILDGFRIFIEKCHEQGLTELAKNAYLYIHTSYPDAGWNFPKILKESGISHKVIFSYLCRACGKWFASPFQDAMCTCIHCGTINAAVLPNVTSGVSSEILGKIMQCFDVYLQISICEGYGMPQVEACACGIPTMGMPYSATKDILEKSGGIPIKIAKSYLEIETQAYRMMPDNNSLADELIKFFSLDKKTIEKLSKKARLACEKFYNYDNTAKIWENYFDSVILKDNQGKWDTTPPLIYEIPEKIPENLNNEQFICFIFNNVLYQPKLRYSLIGLKLITELNLGVRLENGIKPISREEIFNWAKEKAKHFIICEKIRSGIITIEPEDFINYANMKSQALLLKQESS